MVIIVTYYAIHTTCTAGCCKKLPHPYTLPAQYFLVFVASTFKQHVAQLNILAWTDFKLRYHGSVLGYVWALLKPLLIFCVLYVVFSFIFGTTVDFYALRLLTALLAWNFFSEATTQGMYSMFAKGGFLTKMSLPRWLFPVSSTMTTLLGLAVNMLILAVFFVFNANFPSPLMILLALLYIVLLYIGIIGFALGTAVLLPRFRDLSQIWEVLLNVLMYATPIIYPLVSIPEKYRLYLYLNPLTSYIESLKMVLVDHQLPTLFMHVHMAGVTIVCLVAGWLFYRRFAPSLAEYI